MTAFSEPCRVGRACVGAAPWCPGEAGRDVHRDVAVRPGRGGFPRRPPTATTRSASPPPPRPAPGQLFYYHHDTQGSPVDVAGSTGTLYQRWAYDSFGTRVLNTTTSGAPASTPSYTGARYETGTGNLDLHARQYAFTGENGGAGAFVDKYLPVRPAYRLYRAEYMLRQQGCDALADLYAETADELAQQLVLTGVGGLTGWRRTAVATEGELQSGGSSFRRPRSEMDFELEWADHAYDAIRADAQLDRVAQTAASHGYSAADINQIYNHLFIEAHQLDAGMLRFDANPRIARAWERLQNGNPHPSDFDLLAHELCESNWMRQHGDQNYRRAHQATLAAGHTWDEHAPAADGIGFR